MATTKLPQLTRRERQIMDVLYRLERATAAEIQAGLPGEPNYSTVRAQLRVLEEKGHVGHEEEGLRYIYAPTLPRSAARRSALRHLMETFFEGSTEKVIAALVGGEVSRLSPHELERLSQLIAQARGEAKDEARERKQP
jgi:predicted transcriptional regulator